MEDEVRAANPCGICSEPEGDSRFALSVRATWQPPIPPGAWATTFLRLGLPLPQRKSCSQPKCSTNNALEHLPARPSAQMRVSVPTKSAPRLDECPAGSKPSYGQSTEAARSPLSCRADPAARHMGHRGDGCKGEGCRQSISQGWVSRVSGGQSRGAQDPQGMLRLTTSLPQSQL